MKENILYEGLRSGDLADLVLPLISVDEWVSKSGNDCIVFAFYIHDENAAKDLNRFLQKSAVPIVDTEVSPAPDQHGYFMVFIELLNNNRLVVNVTAILAEIKSLVDIEEWQMRVRKTDDLIPFSEDNLQDCLDNIDKVEKSDDILEFLKPSLLSNALIEDQLLILERGGERHVLHIVDFDRVKTLLEKHNLEDTGISYDIRTVAKNNRITYCLGSDWEALKFGKFTLLQNSTDPRGILLR